MGRKKTQSQFRRKPIVFVFGIGLIASALLLISGASGFSLSIEPEDTTQSNVNNATIISDATASSGGAVKFVENSGGTGENCTEEATGCVGQNSSGSVFRENFNGSPSSPRSIVNNFSDRWYMQPTMQGNQTWVPEPEAMLAQHDSNCGKPSSWSGGFWNGIDIPAGFHKISTFEESIYQCKDHVMTAMNPPPDSGGTPGGMLVMKPNHMVDLSKATDENPAIISIDVSTLSSSAGDWWDIWITPWEDQLINPTEHWFHWNGSPKNAVMLTVRDTNPDPNNPNNPGKKRWAFQTFRDYNPQIERFKGGPSGRDIKLENAVDIRPIVSVSDTRRDLYEVRMTKNHIKMFVKSPDDNDLKFVDEFDIPGGFPANAGVVQFLSSNYEPELGGKHGCLTHDISSCPTKTIPATWHWDNALIKPAIPYTIVGANERLVYPDAPNQSKKVTFKKPAPKNARLLFTANSWGRNNFKVSLDNGATWQQAPWVRPTNDEPGISWGGQNDLLTYSVDVPEGLTSVLVQGQDGWQAFSPYNKLSDRWAARNFHIISKDVN